MGGFPRSLYQRGCFQQMYTAPIPVVRLDAGQFSVHISGLATTVVRMGDPQGEET